jgi:hypothetical protein
MSERRRYAIVQNGRRFVLYRFRTRENQAEARHSVGSYKSHGEATRAMLGHIALDQAETTKQQIGRS